jgi:hypothetical protein
MQRRRIICSVASPCKAVLYNFSHFRCKPPYLPVPSLIAASHGSYANIMIHFKDAQLALIHVPLHLYRTFVQTILNVLLPSEDRPNSSGSSGSSSSATKTWPNERPFLNISVTPIECSIVCPRSVADDFFVPAINTLDAKSRAEVSISHEDYVVMQVDGEGLDAGQRVLELTSPLAMAGM